MRSIDYRADPHTALFSQNRAENCFSLSRSIWVPKNAEFYAESKSEDKIEKKCTNKKLFLKPCKKAVFWDFGFGISVKFCVFGTHIDLFEEKKFSVLFCEK